MQINKSNYGFNHLWSMYHIDYHKQALGFRFSSKGIKKLFLILVAHLEINIFATHF